MEVWDIVEYRAIGEDAKMQQVAKKALQELYCSCIPEVLGCKNPRFHTTS